MAMILCVWNVIWVCLDITTWVEQPPIAQQILQLSVELYVRLGITVPRVLAAQMPVLWVLSNRILQLSINRSV
jgi:hypothetical protein